MRSELQLGPILLQEDLVSEEDLERALALQKQTGQKLGRILVGQGLLSEEQISKALASQLGIPYVNLNFFHVPPDSASLLSESQARRFRALVLEERSDCVLVGMANPTDLLTSDSIARLVRRKVEIAAVDETKLLQTIDRLYRHTEEITGLARELEKDLHETYVDFGALSAGAGAEEAPVVKLLQSMFQDALQARASDIHIEPQDGKLSIRFRIDGVLYPQTESDIRISGALALRLKLASGLDISEKRLPQDGRFDVMVRQQRVDVRISTMPTQNGESIVMRLLPQESGFLSLEKLGMPEDMLEEYRRLIQRPNGLVLVTGPTGSGKTTTLYATLSELNTPESKIISVEDPVEYRLSGINQVQVNEKIDLTFSRVLRSALRHDPDIILIGEMRDHETAQIGLRAAMTGHLVLSTLHTNDAASTPIRLIDMEIPKYMVTASLLVVVAQRLVRLVCASCAEPYQPTPNEIEWMKPEIDSRKTSFRQGKGCPQCNGTGFHGRIGLYEMLVMSKAVMQAVNELDISEFPSFAASRLAGGTLRHHAAMKAADGITTISEAMKATSQTEE